MVIFHSYVSLPEGKSFHNRVILPIDLEYLDIHVGYVWLQTSHIFFVKSLTSGPGKVQVLMINQC